MRLGPSPKGYTADGHRTVDPVETLRRIEPLMGRAGILEVIELTELDRIGIPVFASMGQSSSGVREFDGKGASPEQARTSAIMEGIERLSAEYRGQCVIRKGVDDMIMSQDAVDPMSLILPMRTQAFLHMDRIAWVEGVDIVTMEPVMVPATAVFHPYVPDGDLQLFRSNTNGIAAGNTMEEAVLHGLLELVERDAWSICDFNRFTYADIVEVDEGSISSTLLQRFEDSGVEIHLKDLTSDIGLPTFAAAADDVIERDPDMLMFGVGTHLDPEIATIRALTEVAQSRATHLHGVKVDAHRTASNRDLGYERVKDINSMWFSPSRQKVSIRGVRGEDTDDVYEDIGIVLDHLRHCGMSRIVAVDLTREDIGVPVVRMIVPGLEVYAMDPERQGPRLYGK